MALFTGCLFTVKTVIWRYCSNRLNIRKSARKGAGEGVKLLFSAHLNLDFFILGLLFVLFDNTHLLFTCLYFVFECFSFWLFVADVFSQDQIIAGWLSPPGMGSWQKE